ncbi:hypothetical protein MKY04_18050 [Lysinibacillus telephonicus]|uniref:hypothetical protein n=1 Tax=Lysinibacillus telephonicus TaxID=1714840 RepID=UPI0031FD10F4
MEADVNNIIFGIDDDYLVEFQKSSTDGYITSYLLGVSFFDELESIGELHITFDVIGYGLKGFEGGIDVSYQIMYFLDPTDKKEYLDDDEALIFIFTNFGKDIMSIIDLAYNALDDFYEKGIPLEELKKTLLR